MQPKQTLILILVICMFKVEWAQDAPLTIGKIVDVPAPFFNKIQNKYTTLKDRLTQQTEKYLLRLAKRKKELKKKLADVPDFKPNIQRTKSFWQVSNSSKYI